MNFGYVRVSTTKQQTDRQIDLLTEYGVDRIFEDKYTGTKKERPQLSRLLEILRPGDKVIVESYSRLARSTKDLIEIVDMLRGKDVDLVSLKENVDTSTPTGRLVFTLFAGLAEFERDVIVQRTKEGLEASRKRGIRGGRKPVDQASITRALELYDSNTFAVSDICVITGISKATLYNYLAKRKSKAAEQA